MYQYLRLFCTGHITRYLYFNIILVLPVFTMIHICLLIYIICIYPITSYLACNLHHILHIYPSSSNTWCITSFSIFNLIYFSVPCYFFLARFVSEYKLNPVIRILCICPHFSSSSHFCSGHGYYLYC